MRVIEWQSLRFLVGCVSVVWLFGLLVVGVLYSMLVMIVMVIGKGVVMVVLVVRVVMADSISGSRISILVLVDLVGGC